MHRFATDGIEASWKTEFDAFFGAEEGKNLLDFLQDRLQTGAVIYPPDPYRVFRLTQPQDVRVVILGQDPYLGRRWEWPSPFPPNLRSCRRV